MKSTLAAAALRTRQIVSRLRVLISEQKTVQRAQSQTRSSRAHQQTSGARTDGLTPTDETVVVVVKRRRMHLVVVTWLLAGAAAPARRLAESVMHRRASKQGLPPRKGHAAAGGAGPHSSQIEAQPPSQASPFASRRTLSFSHGRPVPGRGRGLPHVQPALGTLVQLAFGLVRDWLVLVNQEPTRSRVLLVSARRTLLLVTRPPRGGYYVTTPRKLPNTNPRPNTPVRTGGARLRDCPSCNRLGQPWCSWGLGWPAVGWLFGST